MKVAIVTLGYEPRIVQSTLNKMRPSHDGTEPIPEPVATALERVEHTDTSIFIDFYAKWCGACKVMDKTTLVDPKVVKTLVQFHTLKVDADEFPLATQHFGVFAMPTYIVLNPSGEEVFRHVGPITAGSLVERLLPLNGDAGHLRHRLRPKPSPSHLD